MATLLMRLCGPMQSWGTRSRFSERDTELEPSKSGAIGLLCAALGRPRATDVSDLAAMRFGVRVNHEGRMSVDYHTAGAFDGVRRASGNVSMDAVLSNRYYLQDADFLVGFESEDSDILQTIEQAIRNPRWQLFLGRKSFAPAVPIHLPNGGIRQLALADALLQEPWPSLPTFGNTRRSERESIRFVIESDLDDPNREVRYDQPFATAFRDRSFGPRAVVQTFHDMEKNDVPHPSHA